MSVILQEPPQEITRQGPPQEDECRARIANPNMLVPWYLMASHAYHWLNLEIISDGLYDEICRRLEAEWQMIEHDHKDAIRFDTLSQCSGNYVTREHMPDRAYWCLQRLLLDGSESPPSV